MPRIQPLERDSLGKFATLFEELEEFFGFLPNDYLTMGRKPEILSALANLTQAVLSPKGKVPMSTKLLITYMTSRSAQCMYCTAHNAALMQRYDLPLEKIVHINEYESNAAFTDAERAALTVAKHANQVPNAVTDEEFDRLREHYDEEEILEIISSIAMMSFYNRWNDTLATTLEKPPAQVADQTISRVGWKIGKHA